MPSRRSPAADLLRRYEQLTDDEQREFDGLLLAKLAFASHEQVTADDLVELLATMPQGEVESFLIWILKQAVPEMARSIAEAMAAPQPGRPAKKERNAAILRLRAEGLTAGEIRLRLPALGFATDKAPTANAIKMVVRRGNSLSREGNGGE
jgi:hypothetical protein